VFILFFAGSVACGEIRTVELGKLHLNVPKDIRISLFAEDVPNARHMAFDDQGILFLSQHRTGTVVALPDKNHDGKSDRTITLLENRQIPHGLAFQQLDSGYYLYVAEEHQVIRMKRKAKPFTYGEPEVIIRAIPEGGHTTRTIKIKGQKIYLSVGSSCNVCVEDDPLRAAVSRFNLDGSGKEIYAVGLRNSVGIEFSPYSGELWGVNNGRDRLGDDHPREELNIIRKGSHYGWPYCYEDKTWDEDFGKKYFCATTKPPAHTFTAHMAPLGLAFYQKGALPGHYKDSLFIAFHGSWNRSVPAGYKVVRVKLNERGDILSHEDFITGWLRPDGEVTGRPVDLEQSPDGDLYLSDDALGVVYRITGN
jgi:glucose/arabinose dehydrogenase